MSKAKSAKKSEVVDVPEEAPNKDLAALVADSLENIDLLMCKIKDMSERQLPKGLVGSSVYSAGAPTRSDLNSMVAYCKKLSTMFKKFSPSTVVKKTGKDVGFALPAHASPELMTFIGISEGTADEPSVLWPRGGKPVFPSSLVTKYIAIYVRLHELINVENPSTFRLDDAMYNLFEPWIEEEGITNTDAVKYTQLQKLTKHLFEKKTAQNPGPKVTSEQREAIAGLKDQFDQLAAYKKDLSAWDDLVAKTTKDLANADFYVEDGTIEKKSKCYTKVAQALNDAMASRDKAFADFRAAASSMGF